MVEDEEETTGGSINIQKFKAGEVQDVVEYPAWMARVDFGSRVLPTDPCVIGDDQPDLIKILLLQMGVNLFNMCKQFHRNFCGTIESAWQHFQSNNKFRMDLDPKVPYLGEDDEGNLIAPTDEQMRELYRQVGNPRSREDVGEEGFVNAYYGSLIFKRLIIYVLECGYTTKDLQETYGGEQFEPLKKDDTPEEEIRKTLRACEALEAQSTFVRRVIAGAYGVNAVYFFRNVNYLNTVTLNPVDILCAS